MGEVSALVWRDLDLDAGTLKIGHTLQRIPTFGEENSGKRTLLQYTPVSYTHLDVYKRQLEE